jgi:hypothetical protein
MRGQPPEPEIMNRSLKSGSEPISGSLRMNQRTTSKAFSRQIEDSPLPAANRLKRSSDSFPLILLKGQREEDKGFGSRDQRNNNSLLPGQFKANGIRCWPVR